jgi:tRNA dimethylallyltransferase
MASQPSTAYEVGDTDPMRDDPQPEPPLAELIAIFGPTGVGKTEIALAVGAILRARGARPVAISADALQVYEGLEVLTSVPAPEQRAALEHRLISFLPLDASFSAGQYSALAHAEIDALLDEGATPIVVGGTGLYLRAALTDLDLRPPPLPGVRERWLAELERRGARGLHALLAERAPWAAEEIDPGDRQRIVRSLELLDAGELEPPEGPSQLWTAQMRRTTRLIGLVMDRHALYERIDARVERMLGEGVREEVRQAHLAGASGTARKALGFQELLGGDIEAMKRHTRNYARRQLTWMRKLADVHVIDVTGRDHGEIAAEILDSCAP